MRKKGAEHDLVMRITVQETGAKSDHQSRLILNAAPGREKAQVRRFCAGRRDFAEAECWKWFAEGSLESQEVSLSVENDEGKCFNIYSTMQYDLKERSPLW